jgi:5-methylcytosine-specific restriction endonuclease McrA
MTFIPLRRPRLRLDATLYKELHTRVLKRDGWRCQSCGCMRNLQVHHIQSRGRLGDDTEENLVTLCAPCHGQIHLGLADCGFPSGHKDYPKWRR